MTTRAYAADTRAGEPLLTVRDLSVTFLRQGEKPFTAVDGVSFDVRPGQTVGLVGESGSGKSVTSLAIMGLLPARGNQVTGTATFDGTDLLALDNNAMRDRRGRDLGMIFQDPLSSLNPVVPIGIQVTEVLERHKGMSRKAAMPKAREMLGWQHETPVRALCREMVQEDLRIMETAPIMKDA